MCIIIAKEKGYVVPEEHLRQSFVYNPDGAGFAFYNEKDKKVHLYKGLMTFENFKTVHDFCFKNFDFKNKNVLYHFRIATVGNVEPGNTQPFVCGEDSVKKLHKTTCKADMVLAHNGTMTHLMSYKNLSDSGTLASLLPKTYEELTSHVSIVSLATNIVSIDRCVVLSKEGFNYLGYGEWEQDKDDVNIFYSNSGYKPYYSKNYAGRYSTLKGKNLDCDFCGKKSKSLNSICNGMYFVCQTCKKDYTNEVNNTNNISNIYCEASRWEYDSFSNGVCPECSSNDVWTSDFFVGCKKCNLELSIRSFY